MTSRDCMKGHACPIKPIICPTRSGCGECQVHLDYQGHQQAMGRTISSSIYPINNLRQRVQDLRDVAFAESAYGSHDYKEMMWTSMNAYEIVLKLIDEVNK